MAASDKDTIYIDIDDEITGIIDKLKASDGKIVALVLPKRASVFQSIVNMKLLKRAADSSKKNLVLITSEAGLLPLAGAAGVHVAKTLTSKPAIPIGPDMDNDAEEEVDEDASEELEPDPDKTVGELAGAGAAAGAIAASDDGVETLTLDNDDLPADLDSKTPKKTFTPPKKDKKLKVPDFDRFRLLLIGGGALLILLIFGFIFANNVLPKATISIGTDSRSIETNISLNLSTTAKTLSEKDNTVPAKLTQTQKTYTQAVPATGQKNNGNKAAGKVKLINCSAGDSITIPAGTGVSGPNSTTYVTQEKAIMPVGSITCTDIPGATSDVVAVVAISGGASYNVAAGTSLTVASNGSFSSSSVKASVSEAITGGTDNIVKIVSQNDITAAKAKITPNESEIKKILSDQLKKENLYAIVATYSAGTPAVTTSPNAGDVADNVTVTENVTYTMFGVKKDDINTLLNTAIKDQIDTNKQSILDNGLNNIVYNVDNLSATGAQVTASTTATAGPELDVEAIKREAAGKKPGPIKDKLKTNPDVTTVEIKLSPFWVSSVPNKTSKITVDIAKPSASTPSSSNGSNQ
jgi:hypothetical protein